MASPSRIDSWNTPFIIEYDVLHLIHACLGLCPCQCPCPCVCPCPCPCLCTSTRLHQYISMSMSTSVFVFVYVCVCVSIYCMIRCFSLNLFNLRSKTRREKKTKESGTKKVVFFYQIKMYKNVFCRNLNDH